MCVQEDHDLVFPAHFSLYALSDCRGLVIAMLTSLLFIVLLRFLAGIMVWVMIALVLVVIGYGKGRSTCSFIIVFVILTSPSMNT